MYTITEVRPERIAYKCEHCGSTNIEVKIYCQWSVDRQLWVASDDDPDVCNECYRYACPDCDNVGDYPLKEKIDG